MPRGIHNDARYDKRRRTKQQGSHFTSAQDNADKIRPSCLAFRARSLVALSLQVRAHHLKQHIFVLDDQNFTHFRSVFACFLRLLG